jgi:hypothetical protein
MDNEIKLKIEINNKRPVELLDLAKSMISMSDEYKRFLAKNELHVDPEHVKLYIKQIYGGSIITELVSLAPYALPLIDHAEIVVEYTKHIKSLYEWLNGDEEKQQHAEKSALENLNNIIEPIAKDRGSQMNIGAVNVSGDYVVNYNINSTNANATQNSIKRHLSAMKEPVTGIHHDVVMYWAQARNDPNGSKAGDHARIESIYKGDVKVKFLNDQIKLKILYKEPHPFSKAFVVDVAVETVNEKPILYKILELHDVLEKE